MLDKILGGTKILEKSLDATWLRNEVISNNIANKDTPGYKRKVVDFEKYLEDAIEQKGIEGFTNDPRHIPIGRKNVDQVSAKVSEDNKFLNNTLDGNNVDIENEMASSAKNYIQYNVLAQKLNGEVSKIKSAINEGRR